MDDRIQELAFDIAALRGLSEKHHTDFSAAAGHFIDAFMSHTESAPVCERYQLVGRPAAPRQRAQALRASDLCRGIKRWQAAGRPLEPTGAPS